MKRRSIFMRDELWSKVQKAAAAEGMKRGEPMHASEWIRKTLATRLKGLGRDPDP